MIGRNQHADLANAVTGSLTEAGETPTEITAVNTDGVVGLLITVTAAAKLTQAANAAAGKTAIATAAHFRLPADTPTYFPFSGPQANVYIEHVTGGPTANGLSYVPIYGPGS